MSANNSQRQRGFILTTKGKQKMKAQIDKLEIKTGVKYTPTRIAEQAQLNDPQGLHPTTVRKIMRQSGVDLVSLQILFRALGLEIEKQDYSRPRLQTITKQNWGEAADVAIFYDRAAEITQLEQWIVEEQCRLVAILGTVGVGKTSLAVKLAHQIQDHFNYLIWKNLADAPSVEELLAQIIDFLSDRQEQETNLPSSFEARFSRLLHYLRQHRCLVVLDGVESILRFNALAGRYQKGYENYQEMFRRLSSTVHQSAIVITSQERPQGISELEGIESPIHSIQLSGLSTIATQEILSKKGLVGNFEELNQLSELYQGNPRFLKLVASSIKGLFSGNITDFLDRSAVIVPGIRHHLDRQYERLSVLEKKLLYWLAYKRKPVTLEELSLNFIPIKSPAQLLEALDSLMLRSFVARKVDENNTPAKFYLQSLIMVYVREKLLEQIRQKIRQDSSQSSTTNFPFQLSKSA